MLAHLNYLWKRNEIKFKWKSEWCLKCWEENEFQYFQNLSLIAFISVNDKIFLFLLLILLKVYIWCTFRKMAVKRWRSHRNINDDEFKKASKSTRIIVQGQLPHNFNVTIGCPIKYTLYNKILGHIRIRLKLNFTDTKFLLHSDMKF